MRAFLAAIAIVAFATPSRADESPAITEQTAPADAARFSLEAAAGPAYLGFVSTHLTGGDIQLAFGAEFRHFAIYGTGGALFGKTEYGLAIQTLQMGGIVESIVGRIRIGGGLQFGCLSIARVSGTTDAMFGIGVGGNLFASVDLVRFGPHAIFLTGKLSGDFYGQNLFLVGPSGLIGLRY